MHVLSLSHSADRLFLLAKQTICHCQIKQTEHRVSLYPCFSGKRKLSKASALIQRSEGAETQIEGPDLHSDKQRLNITSLTTTYCGKWELPTAVCKWKKLCSLSRFVMPAWTSLPLPLGWGCCITPCWQDMALFLTLSVPDVTRCSSVSTPFQWHVRCTSTISQYVLTLQSVFMYQCAN